MVGTLPIRTGDLVLEMACGDGAYTPWLSAKVGPEGGVVGLDVSTG
jgi:ubiquinone/menaquinone biosynthesis C-methylase UbiE